MAKVKSYCKINLFLRVVGKEKNYHKIQSVNFLINLYDEIFITRSKKNDKIKFIGPFKNIINQNNNTVTKTLKILREEKIIDPHVRYNIIVNKKIPPFAGLGGGTSNAFFVAKYLLKKRLNSQTLKILKKSVGTDLLIFKENQNFQPNLNKIKKLRKKYNLNFILVKPSFGCSTKKVYSKVNRFINKTFKDFSKINSKKQFISLIKDEKNDLQNIVTMQHTPIKTIINFLQNQKGCHFSRMTGSGSVCYGVFDSINDSKKALRNVKKEFPNYWCQITKTI